MFGNIKISFVDRNECKILLEIFSKYSEFCFCDDYKMENGYVYYYESPYLKDRYVYGSTCGRETAQMDAIVSSFSIMITEIKYKTFIRNIKLKELIK